MSKVGEKKYSIDMSNKATSKNIGDTKYFRLTIKTHFVTETENYLDLISTYVKPQYRKGDILVISEKIIAICQNRIIYKNEIKVSPMAKFLSRFVHVTSAGRGIGNPEKMQVVIERAGIIRIIIGAIAAAITRPLGIKGVFYRIVQCDSNHIDGFTDVAFDYYKDKGILSPKKPDQVCQHIKDKLNIDSVIVDANDLNVEILGMSKNLPFKPHLIKEIIKDNPAGQRNEQTPFLLIKSK